MPLPMVCEWGHVSWTFFFPPLLQFPPTIPQWELKSLLVRACLHIVGFRQGESIRSTVMQFLARWRPVH